MDPRRIDNMELALLPDERTDLDFTNRLVHGYMSVSETSQPSSPAKMTVIDCQHWSSSRFVETKIVAAH